MTPAPRDRDERPPVGRAVGFPAKLRFLFEPAPYKIAYGGRGGAKTWNFAAALLIIGQQRKIRVLCARELQKSMDESVHQTLVDVITAYGFDGFYTVQKTEIVGRNGTMFMFAGLRHNVDSIKSKAGINICWVEEADTVSKVSWEKLEPTLRTNALLDMGADVPELWISFNPQLEEDETFKRFVLKPPPGAKVVKIDWRDNPWFPDDLRAKMEHLKETDRDEWLNVYEGHCRPAVSGAIYAEELRAAQDEGRITKVPYDRSKPVSTFWDLGHSDATSIWFAQIVGFETRVIDFYQNSHKALQHYLEALQGRGYVYENDWLPHDGKAKQLATGRSIEELMREAGRKVRIVPNLSVADGINAARTAFPNLWFDAEKCADGLQCLRRYRYDVDAQSGRVSKNPMHDENSHAADALRYLALGMKEPRKPVKMEQPKRVMPQLMGTGMGWMR